MTDLGLVAGEVALLAGTAEEQAAAYAHIGLLERNVRDASVARVVRVVDLRAGRNGAATTAAAAMDQPHDTPWALSRG